VNHQVYRYLIFPSGQKWTWELYAPNGIVVCRSCRTFKFACEAKKSVRNMIEMIRTKAVQIIEESKPKTTCDSNGYKTV